MTNKITYILGLTFILICLLPASTHAYYNSHGPDFLPALPTWDPTKYTEIDYFYRYKGTGDECQSSCDNVWVTATTYETITYHLVGGGTTTSTRGWYYQRIHYGPCVCNLSGTGDPDSITYVSYPNASFQSDVAWIPSCASGGSIPPNVFYGYTQTGPTTQNINGGTLTTGGNTWTFTDLTSSGCAAPNNFTVHGWGGGAIYELSITINASNPTPGLPSQTPTDLISAGQDAGSVHLCCGSFNGTGGFQFQVTGPNGDSGSVKASTDLINWTQVGTVSMTGSAVTFTDSQASGYSYRFYKVYDATSGECSDNSLGFDKVTCVPNWNMIANQLDNGSGNLLNDVLPNVPNGTTIYKWNNGTQAYQSARFLSGAWTANLSLNPGEGALLSNLTANSFTLTFTGEVLQGNLANNVGAPNYAIVSSMVPQTGRPDTALGFPVSNGDQISQIIPGSTGPSYNTFTYSSSTGNWSPSNPTVGVGEAFWSNKAASFNWTRTFSVGCP